MEKTTPLRFYPGIFLFPLLWVGMLWVIYWAEIRFGFNLREFGIYPMRTKGVMGIFTGPFVHGSLEHLFNNSIPLLVLTASLFYFYRRTKWMVLILGYLLTGIITWLIGRPAWHIGVSGVIYMLVAFLFFSGIRSKQYRLTALSFVVVFLYGSLLWYVFPIDDKISWEGHLSGFIVGTVFAYVFKGPKIPEKKYDWQRDDYNPEEDPFLQQFDEHGNFIENPKQEEVSVSPRIKITYRFIPKKESEEE
ncbi:rhomboid family intramembrane serine protease [Luteirhabdus pelagi]|uniref:rhomboid family intramembrane serine protease n=1 Tax=Luteirhabdus pelagi TaxID=2792783 RepID=UPI00193A9F4A|nr:rhomboid family intramembrane serine protease [Luteirhabdus pelagi]